MVYRSNGISFERGSAGEKTLQAFSIVKQAFLLETFEVAREAETEKALAKATSAFEKYNKTTFSQQTGPVSLVLNQTYGG